MTRPGSIRELFPHDDTLAPRGRLLECASCHELVDIIEIDLGGTGSSMRPDVCGQCIVAGHDPEPRLQVAR